MSLEQVCGGEGDGDRERERGRDSVFQMYCFVVNSFRLLSPCPLFFPPLELTFEDSFGRREKGEEEEVRGGG